MAKLDVYSKITFDFIDNVREEEDADVLRDVIVAELAKFGFEYATIWSLPPPGQSPLDGVLLNTRPMNYVERYVARNYVAKDPVILELKRKIRPFSWGDVRKCRKLSADESRIIDEAGEFDIHDGLIIPIITYGGSLAIVSPCGRAPDLSPRARSAVELI